MFDLAGLDERLTFQEPPACSQSRGSDEAQPRDPQVVHRLDPDARPRRPRRCRREPGGARARRTPARPASAARAAAARVPSSSLKSSIVIEPATSKVCSSIGVIVASGRSNSSSISPTSSSRTSSSATMPAVSPYSSTHDRELLALLAQLAQQRAEVLGLGHDVAGRASSPTGPGRRPRGAGDEVADVHDADQRGRGSRGRPDSGSCGASRPRGRAPRRGSGPRRARPRRARGSSRRAPRGSRSRTRCAAAPPARAG